jgi:hypothetical protein
VAMIIGAVGLGALLLAPQVKKWAGGVR